MIDMYIWYIFSIWYNDINRYSSIINNDNNKNRYYTDWYYTDIILWIDIVNRWIYYTMI